MATKTRNPRFSGFLLSTVGGHSNTVLLFTPKIGEDESVLTNKKFKGGWFNHQPDKLSPQKSQADHEKNSHNWNS